MNQTIFGTIDDVKREISRNWNVIIIESNTIERIWLPFYDDMMYMKREYMVRVFNETDMKR